jgi:hypothetical protein
MKIKGKAAGYAHHLYTVELTKKEAATKSDNEIITAADNNSPDFSNMQVRHFGGVVTILPASTTTVQDSYEAIVKVYID